MKKNYFLLSIILHTFILQINAQNLELESFGPEFLYPTYLGSSGIPSDTRMFVSEQAGYIKILRANGTTPATPFLDIESLVFDDYQSGWEQGFLSFVFHPDYSNNGYIFVNYVDQDEHNIISRFTVTSDPDIADNSSELIIMDIPHPYSHHYGGDMAFGPNGYLYISRGDGGTDQGDPENRSQDLSELSGKMLRIDVDNPSGGKNYGIPAGNPFVETPIDDPNTLAEIWLYGFRNPAKFSFDGNDLWIGDVGQKAYEEINLNEGNVPGLNYGWRCYEGTDDFNTSGCPPLNNTEVPTHQIHHFDEPDGGWRCAIAGGYVYRGSAYPGLSGLYFFADWCSGEIFTLTEDNGSWVRTINSTSVSNDRFVAFGQDNNNELYILSNPLDDGQVYKVKQTTLSVNALDKNTFSLIPNPSNEDVATLSFIKPITLSKINAINLHGQKISLGFKAVNSKSATIEIDNLSGGIYFIETISNNGERSINKLIVK